MSRVLRRSVLPAIVMLVAGLFVVVAPAHAGDCAPPAVCDGDGGSGGGGSDLGNSSGNKSANYSSGGTSCSVYANGRGMGLYCVGPGSPTLKTLRERYGDQKLQVCRYSEIPSGIQAPFNSRPDEGHYMLMRCLRNIDFDTYAGGTKRAIDLSIVFVENGTDIDDRHNGISDFLWDAFNRTTQLPVPFMRTRPSVVPLVGIPTFFTFRWLDPTHDNDVVAEGPFKGDPDGGPYMEIEQRGVVMRAEATEVSIDPNQKGIKSVTCDPATPYVEGASSKDQPADACSIVFPRSSASARKLATEEIPSNVKDAFYATVQVTWKVTYGDGGADMNELGDNFTMRLRQVLPVQEVQAPNQPPAVIY